MFTFKLDNEIKLAAKIMVRSYIRSLNNIVGLRVKLNKVHTTGNIQLGLCTLHYVLVTQRSYPTLCDAMDGSLQESNPGLRIVGGFFTI